MSTVKKILGKWVMYGFSFKRIALGVSVDKYGISLELIWVWVTVKL